jgi:hypothetical protein
MLVRPASEVRGDADPKAHEYSAEFLEIDAKGEHFIDRDQERILAVGTAMNCCKLSVGGLAKGRACRQHVSRRQCRTSAFGTPRCDQTAAQGDLMVIFLLISRTNGLLRLWLGFLRVCCEAF